jgi:histidinol-phosphate aminotransferase
MGQIGALHAVPREHVVVGPGSIGVLDAVLHAHFQTKGSTVFGTPTFDEYSALVSRAGGISVEAASDPPGKQVLNIILSRVDASTRQVIIAAPHNPSGAAVSMDELVRFRLALPKTVLLVVDQAYAEFDETMPPDAVRRIVTEIEDVVVLRSFSKAYGLAGLRIGYGVFSSAALAARVRSAVPMFSVNSLALTAAEESLRHQQQLQERVSRVVENRKRLEAFLRQHDLFSGIVSQGNFVWLPTQDSKTLFQHALTDGILLREYPGLGVRITVQSDASVDAVLESLTKFSASTPGWRNSW